MLDAAVNSVETVLQYLSKYFVGKDLASYCELETVIGLSEGDKKRRPLDTEPYTLVSSAGYFATMFDVQGTFQILSSKEFDDVVENLRIKLGSLYQRPGHHLSFGYESDPDRAQDELMRIASPQIKTAKRLGLASEDIIIDRVRRNAPFVTWEQNLLVAYTHPSCLQPDELKRAYKQIAADAKSHAMPRTEYSQNPAMVLMALKDRHDSFIERVEADFRRAGVEGRPGVLLRRLSAYEATKRIRIMVNREGTSQAYRAVLAGDRIVPRGREDEADYSDLLPPSIKYQVCSSNIRTEENFVMTGRLAHATLSLELAPQVPKPFDDLKASLDKRSPWRVRFDLAPGGLDSMRGRRAILSFTGMVPSNREIRDSFAQLEERSRADAICSMKVTFSTWGSSIAEARLRANALEMGIQGWGVCTATSVHGDPVGAWAATIPGMTAINPACRHVPPLGEALRLLPLNRPANPWGDSGSFPLRTQDGKIYAIQLGSRLQDSWFELIAALPGSGKSVYLNSMNFAAVHRPGAKRLPLLTNIEVGPSSEGLIRLLRDSLPAERKGEAVYLALQNTPSYMVNPGDTQLGARYLMERERQFMVSFLTLLCSNPTDKEAPSGCSQVAEQLIQIAYEDKATRAPNTYESGVEPEVDAALEECGLKALHDDDWWDCASWWEVTDMLFAAGRLGVASKAQRQAVPVLSDFSAYLNNESIRDQFKEASVGSESLLAYMNRCFTSAASNYLLFSGRTRFELNSEVRVVGIDLGHVIGDKTPAGCLRTALMFMFARQLAAKNYFLREQDVLPVVPALYKDYHRARVADVGDEQKTIAYDELHNAGGYKPFMETLEKDGREGRKWGIRIVCCSQYLSDFPDGLRGAATAIYVMRGGNKADEEILQRVFAVSNEAIRRLGLEANGPGPEGGNFLAIFRTKLGTVVQMLTNTVGPIEMWAFSTTQEDVALRSRLYERIGAYAARRLLADEYPTGSALAVIEKLREQAIESDDVSVVEKLFQMLIGKYESTHPKEFA